VSAFPLAFSCRRLPCGILPCGILPCGILPVLGLMLLLGSCSAAKDDEIRGLVLLDTTCSAPQRAILDEAMAEARLRLVRALRLVRRTPRHSHIRRWFGDAPPSLILTTLTATAEAMVPPLELDFHCNDTLRCTARRVAYSSQGGRLLGVCPRFFDAPATGLDSRYGILIHEMTHLAGRTYDHIYGPRPAEQLSKTASLAAADNADNYEYFVETLPR